MRAWIALAALSFAPAAWPEAWNALHGEWHGTGTVRGMPAEVALSFRPALGKHAHHLTFRNTMRGEAGESWEFSAEAFYLCDAQGACRGHWYDSRGEVLRLTVAVQGERIVVDWGDDATERGRTTYSPLTDGSLSISDEVRSAEGTWKVFGTTTARRVSAQEIPCRGGGDRRDRQQPGD